MTSGMKIDGELEEVVIGSEPATDTVSREPSAESLDDEIDNNMTSTEFMETFDKGFDTIVIPLCLAPIVSVAMCERAGLQTCVNSCRKAVTDKDGREWSVVYSGGQDDIVCYKSVATTAQEQIFSQYERLRESKAHANHLAKAYKDAYAKQKNTDTPALRESSRPAVEKIIAASDESDRLFSKFEKAHPECKLKRLKAEESYWTNQANVARLNVKKQETNSAAWQEKIDALPIVKVQNDDGTEADGPLRDDNLEESLKGSNRVLAELQARLDNAESKLKAVQEAASMVKAPSIEAVIIRIPVGSAVTFVQ